MPIITPINPSARPAEGAPSQSAQDSRARAIAKLMGGRGEASPVADASSVSVEELGAISTKKPEEEPAHGETIGQTDKVEATSDKPLEEAKTPAPEDDKALSPQFAMLARKEKALRQKAQQQADAFKQQEATLLAREEAFKAKETEYQEQYVSKEQLKSDPWSTLQQLGLTYDQLTEMALNQPQVNPAQKALIDRLEAKINALEKSQETQAKSAKDQQSEAYKQAVEQIRGETQRLVDRDVAFETIKQTGSVDDVVDLIERTFKEENRLMTVQEAAGLVEEHLVEEAMKLFTGTKKFQERLKPAEKSAAPAQQQSEPVATKQSQGPAKTLTNSMGTQRKLTARERAIMAFNANKKTG